MNVILVGLAAFLGAIAVALLGWSQANPPTPFNPRMFLSSTITAVIAAVGIAAAFDYSGSTSNVMCLLAFLSGAGLDAGRSRIAGAFAAKVIK